ncbi:unnamed protein product [Phytophthora fragariaefolia]|uniref:Unnamed protein product n=1 Tax=Phytophthora fragariaefolia TaxID=1490495 RepID=A0A9W6Y1S0_9STRA|nr:unnamed protein product [Phytophthora fragariaefolia]
MPQSSTPGPGTYRTPTSGTRSPPQPSLALPDRSVSSLTALSVEAQARHPSPSPPMSCSPSTTQVLTRLRDSQQILVHHLLRAVGHQDLRQWVVPQALACVQILRYTQLRRALHVLDPGLSYSVAGNDCHESTNSLNKRWDTMLVFNDFCEPNDRPVVNALTDTRVAEAMPTEDAPQIESCIVEELENCNLVDGEFGSDDDIENESDCDDESNL